MEQTKETALRDLGVTSRKQLKALVGKLELVRVTPGRSLLSLNRFAPSIIVGIAGDIQLKNAEHDVRLPAPFVLDSWVADERRISAFNASSIGPATCLLVDWRHRDHVFAHVPALHQLSNKAVVAVMGSRLTDTAPTKPVRNLARFAQGGSHVST